MVRRRTKSRTIRSWRRWRDVSKQVKTRAVAIHFTAEMSSLSFDIDSVIAGRSRLSESQALELHAHRSLQDLGEWAQAVTRRLHPHDYRTYVIDRNINYTNVCTAKCTFCAFRRD